MKWLKVITPIILLVCMVGVVVASTINPLTKAFANTLYCQLTGCNMQGNINMMGYNITNGTLVNLESQNITGDLIVSGTVTASSYYYSNGTELVDTDTNTWNRSEDFEPYFVKIGDVINATGNTTEQIFSAVDNGTFAKLNVDNGANDFTINGNTFCVDSTSQTVGIGTSNPGFTLDIQSPSEATLLLMSDNDNNAADTDAIIRFRVDGTSTNKASIRYDQGLDALTMGTSSSRDIVISSAGNIGIGTPNPITLLDNRGTKNTGYVGDNAINWYTTDANSYAASIKNSGSGGKGLHLETSASAEALIVEKGQVGMGTTSPKSQTLVEIEKTHSTGSSYSLLLDSIIKRTSSGTNYVRAFNLMWDINISNGVTDNGYIYGISFDMLRDVGGDAGTLKRLEGLNTAFGHYSGISSSAKTNYTYGINLRPYYMAGKIDNIHGLHISAPAKGGTVTNKYAIYSEWDADSYLMGGVGIGTTTPTSKLDVNGNATIQQNLTIGQRLSFILGTSLQELGQWVLKFAGDVRITDATAQIDIFDNQTNTTDVVSQIRLGFANTTNPNQINETNMRTLEWTAYGLQVKTPGSTANGNRIVLTGDDGYDYVCGMEGDPSIWTCTQIGT